MFDFLPHQFFWKIFFVFSECLIVQPQPGVILLASYMMFDNEYIWHSIYDWMIDGKEEFSQYDFMWFSCVMIPAWFIIVYWGNGMFMLFMDVKFPEFMDQFRVQKDKSGVQKTGNSHLLNPDLTPRYANIGKICKQNAINTVLLPFMLFPYIGFLQFCTPFKLTVNRDLPHPWDMAWQMAVNVIVFQEFFFWAGHRYMHYNKWVYKNIHKIHHELHSPMAMASIYCHPIEFFVSNVFPWSVGLFVFNCHAYTMLTWIGLGIFGTQMAHSGFQCAWSKPQYHDLHHQYFNCNYGTTGFFDWCFGTLVNPKMAALFNMAVDMKVLKPHEIITKLADGGEIIPKASAKTAKAA